ncbi:MAG TPA: cbb3-type cytochrome c oxidase N-terminal domain-containing protein [Tepidisphaeraceae bacterium]
MNDQLDTEQPLTDHVYDGIREYDNPMPGWWKWIFVGTVLFSGMYVVVVAMSVGEFTPIGVYDREVIAELQKSGAFTGDAATLVRFSKNPDMLKGGAAIFATNCIACHAKDGQGLIGPNLTDNFYINVEKVDDIFDVITKGRKNGAMPAWGNRLSNNERVLAAAYVASLRGKNLEGKPHEGKEIAPWPEH